jgi:hypothetical protein
MRSTTTFLLISPLLTLSALAQVPGEPRKTEPQAEVGTTDGSTRGQGA